VKSAAQSSRPEAGPDAPSTLQPPHVLTPSRLRVRDQFPIFAAHPGLVYLDSAATTQKPQRVIDRLTRFYTHENANIHRGMYALSTEATARYDEARATVANFVGAGSPSEIIFTRGTTEGINLVAQSWGGANLRAGDEVLVTEMEHHSNWVPWQLVAERTGAVLKAVPVTATGELDLDVLPRLLTQRTKLLALAHASNVLGTVNPVRRIADLAHAAGALVLVDAAQFVAHGAVDVVQLGCDFLVFSGHKLFAPLGIGAVWAREATLERMPPWQGGGGMIETVSLERTTWADLPLKFEAGTPAVAEAVAMAEAIAFVQSLGFDAIADHEHALLEEASARLGDVRGVRLIGTAPEKVAVVSFTLDGVHPHDLGTILDGEGIAIRAGHHCAQPLMRRFDIPATARASFSVYNTAADVEALVSGVEQARRLLA
jgi:cysteine desulfurase/selenocysteine lyase